MNFLTWDTGILAAFILLLSYSLLLRKHKALATLVSVYIGYVIANIWGQPIAEFFSGDRVLANQVWVQANASPLVVKSILLVVVTLLLSTFMKLGGKRSKFSMVEVVLYAVSTVLLGLLFIISYMTPEMKEHVLTTSQIAPHIYKFKDWILVIPVFFMVFFGMYGNGDE
jgi:hypothetical protein